MPNSKVNCAMLQGESHQRHRGGLGLWLHHLKLWSAGSFHTISRGVVRAGLIQPVDFANLSNLCTVEILRHGAYSPKLLRNWLKYNKKLIFIMLRSMVVTYNQIMLIIFYLFVIQIRPTFQFDLNFLARVAKALNLEIFNRPVFGKNFVICLIFTNSIPYDQTSKSNPFFIHSNPFRSNLNQSVRTKPIF